MLVVGGMQKEIDDVKRAFAGEFITSDFGPVSWYLRLKIARDISSGKMFLFQASCMKKILERFRMQKAKSVNTSMVKQIALANTDKRYHADNFTMTLYQQAISSLVFTMIETRFDIAYTVSTVSQYASNPTPEHVTAVKQIFRYLRNYLNLGIIFSQDKASKLKRHIDSD